MKSLEFFLQKCYEFFMRSRIALERFFRFQSLEWKFGKSLNKKCKRKLGFSFPLLHTRLFLKRFVPPRSPIIAGIVLDLRYVRCIQPGSLYDEFRMPDMSSKCQPTAQTGWRDASPLIMKSYTPQKLKKNSIRSYAARPPNSIHRIG